MSENQVSQKVVEQLFALDEDELFKRLGILDAGQGEDLVEAMHSLDRVRSLGQEPFRAAGGHDESFSDDVLDWLKEKGMALFNQVWGEAKAIVCKLYRDKATVADNKDLIAYLVPLVVSAVTDAAAPLLLLVVTIAVKRGLDSLCELKPA